MNKLMQGLSFRLEKKVQSSDTPARFASKEQVQKQTGARRAVNKYTERQFPASINKDVDKMRDERGRFNEQFYQVSEMQSNGTDMCGRNGNGLFFNDIA